MARQAGPVMAATRAINPRAHRGIVALRLIEIKTLVMVGLIESEVDG